jgi:hypothetical protein
MIPQKQVAENKKISLQQKLPQASSLYKVMKNSVRGCVKVLTKTSDAGYSISFGG